MPQKNRSTLKKYFKEGALPTSDQFTDFIDSTLNIVEEGFTKSIQNGLEISLIENAEKLISFYKDKNPDDAIWSISLDPNKNTLLINKINDNKATSLMSFTSEGNVGIKTKNPEFELDVAGTLRSQGKIGTNRVNTKTVLADGDWHNITTALSGCQALEVMAGSGREGTGKYSLLRAVAINTFNPRGLFFNFFRLKNRIKYQQSYYLSAACKLKLRWKSIDENYYLQIRSNCNYGDGIRIQCYITDLWFDKFMMGSQSKQTNSADNSDMANE